MTKATIPSTPLTPLGLDDFTEPTLARRWARFWYVLTNAASELWRNRLATVGAVMVLIVLLVALLAPFLARYDPVKPSYREMFQGPSAAHYFGTDKFGRDIWSRVLWGAQRSVIISVLAVMVGVMCGVPLGTLSGFYGGWLDAVLMRVVDAWLAFPGILFYLIAATIIQAYKLSLFWNTAGLILALGIAQMPSMARLVRGSVLAEKEREYVEASRVIGEGHLSIAFRQILPNCLSPAIIQATISLGFVMLILAALSF